LDKKIEEEEEEDGHEEGLFEFYATLRLHPRY
jgi:hypothetical protein